MKPTPVRPIPRMRLVIDRTLPIPAPQAAPPSPQPPNPTIGAAAGKQPEAVDRFAAQVRAAIQAAIVYPPAAKMMKQQGRTKVASGWSRDGRRILWSFSRAEIPAIDTAAIEAVRDAAYPAAPAELTGKPLAFAVFVEFNLSRS